MMSVFGHLRVINEIWNGYECMHVWPVDDVEVMSMGDD